MNKSILLKKPILLGITLLVACNQTTDYAREVRENAKPLVTHTIKTDFLLGRPNQITILGDTLIISDEIEGKCLALYDSKNDTFIGRQLPIGQGPNEVILPILLPRSTEIEDLSIMQRQSGRFTEYDLSTLSNGVYSAVRSLELKNTDRLAQTSTGFITSGPYEEGSIRILDRSGNPLGFQNIYPDYINNLRSFSDRYIYGQGHIVYNNKSNVLAFASYFTGQVAFYQRSSDSFNKLSDFDYALSSDLYSRIRNSTEAASLNPTDIEYFSDIYSTADHFYLLFTGVAMNSKNTASYNYIFKYSNKGKFIDSYKTDKKITSFCVHKDDKKAYAIALSKEMDYVLVEVDII